MPALYLYGSENWAETQAGAFSYYSLIYFLIVDGPVSDSFTYKYVLTKLSHWNEWIFTEDGTIQHE